jgi:hypothetical protein
MSQSLTTPSPAAPLSTRPNPHVARIVGAATLIWLVAYTIIQPLANWLV